MIKLIHRIDARTIRVVITAAATYLGRFGSGLVVLVTLPMARQALHPELFGVWMMLSALFGFMAFADLGVGNSVLNRVTLAHASQNDIMMRRTLVSGYIVTSVIGLILWLAWLAWESLSPEPTMIVGMIDLNHHDEAIAALSAFVLVMAINIPASLIQRVQLGMQEGYWNGAAQFVASMVSLAAIPLVLRQSGSVDSLVYASLGVQAAVNVINTFIWVGRYKLVSLHGWRNLIDFSAIADLLKKGFLFFLLQASASFAFQSDAIVITQTLGQAAYGDFAVIQKLFLFGTMLLSAAIGGLWPAFGDAIARNDTVWAHKVLVRGMVVAAGFSLIFVSGIALAMPWIMATWMHGVVQVSWTLIAVLALWTVMDATSNVVAMFLNGAGILRLQAVIAVLMAAMAFGGKWILTPMLGPEGAVLSTIFSYLLIVVPVYIWILRRHQK